MALKVAIVGRPNVGKSTLFNRLTGKRMALVHDRPGVTRDRREATARLGGLDILLFDTPGLEEADAESLEGRMRAQTEAAIAEADVCLFVIDARAGVTPIDGFFADLARRSNKAVILLANKAEGRAGDGGVLDAYEMGFGEPIPVSAEHGEGMSDVYDALAAEAERLGVAADDEEDPNAPVRIAFVGRPNAGKSTLVNAILGEERMLTGPEAGITRDAVAVRWDWRGQTVRIHDTAGLRKRANVVDAVERLSTSDTVRAIRFAEVVILVLDAENAFEKQDLQIADLILREGRAIVYAVTKWDAVTDGQARASYLRERAGRLLPQAPDAPMIFLSGLTGRNLEKLMPAVMAVRENWSAKVKTRDLNDWLSEVVQRHPPPAVNGKRIKPRYISQTKSRPPTFVLMCSRAEQLPEAYKRYLINGIRDAFDLPAVPIRMIVRAGKNPYAASD